MGPNPQSATTRLYHLWSGGLCRTWVPCTALARLILCIYPALIHCSAAWKLLPSQEFRVVTRFMLAELARNWSWAPRCSQINHPQRERDGAVEDKQIAFLPPLSSAPHEFLFFSSLTNSERRIRGRMGRETQPQADTETIAQLKTCLWPLKRIYSKA